MNEFDLIRKITSKIRTSSRVKIGIGDDCAVLKDTKSAYLLFAQDTIVEDVHFRLNSITYEEIGWKALACNMSDIASMGGWSLSATISMGVPRHVSARSLIKIYDGLMKLAKRFDVDLVGGDTVRSPKKLFVSVSILGRVEKKCLVLRKGAKVGDAVLCTGSLGGSFYGKHKRFTPRQSEARFLVKNFNIHSMIDISDGLVGDLGHMLVFSGCQAVLFERTIPISRELKRKTSLSGKKINCALYDGEDYELLFCIASEDVHVLLNRAKKQGIPISHIGTISKKGKGVILKTLDGRLVRLPVRAFTHNLIS